MRYIAIIYTLLLLTSCKGQNTAITTKIDIEILRKEAIGKDVQLVDVRTAKEYNNGHIDDAINIDISNKDNFKQEVSKLDTSKPIFIYCHIGGRSHRASKILETIGFKEVYDFSGGWKTWNQQ
ncbi:rhodanese-like domain-containing protein [uncultured Algibacter sp.]|uniref:rhodanese-like domain-containing protein n=1 Tax=uncultured Algibacter sp. TaxID=298659 RepID=UPI00321644CE